MLATVDNFEPVIGSLPPTGEDMKIYFVPAQDGQSYSEQLWDSATSQFITIATHQGDIGSLLSNDPNYSGNNKAPTCAVVQGLYSELKIIIQNYLKEIIENGFFVIDADDNIGMKYDSEGLDAALVSSHLVTLLQSVISPDMFQEVQEDGFFVCDGYGNIALRIDGNGAKIIETLDVNLHGKTVALLGDSITEQTAFPTAFANIGKCNILNFGVSGTHLAKRSSNTTNDFISRVPNIPTSVDAVVVLGGTNDFGHSGNSSYGTAHPFGEFTDGANPSLFTFCAGVHNLFKALYNKFTTIGVPVVIVLPPHHGNRIDTHEYNVASDGTLTEVTNDTTGKTYREYVDMIRQIAEFYSFNIVDAYGQSNINPCIDFTYSSDGLHLNKAGGEKLARYIIGELAIIFKMFNK